MITRNELEEKLLYQFKSEHDLVKAIDELNAIFVQKRELLHEYGLDERLVSAYVLFYMSTNMPKLEYVLKLIPKDLLNRVKDYNLVDVGCGPGTFLLALKHYWPEFTGKLYGVDRSKLMLKQAQVLLDCDSRQISAVLPNEKEGIVLFGNAANEMGTDQVLKTIAKLDPRLLIFIEPGTKESFRNMLAIRTQLVTRHGYSILYPCSLSAACAIEHEDNWCHQILKVKHDQSIERITQLAKKDRRTLPATIHLYTKNLEITPVAKAILFRCLEGSKYSFEWEVCSSADGENEIFRMQVMKRDLDKDTLKKLSHFTPGEVLYYKKEKELGNAYLRASLIF